VVVRAERGGTPAPGLAHGVRTLTVGDLAHLASLTRVSGAGAR
jgi:hypothetical protein